MEKVCIFLQEVLEGGSSIIITLEGIQGAGKSITATALLHNDFHHHDRRIIANTTLNFQYTHFDLAYFLKHIEDDELTNCDIWLDEMYQLLDSRNSVGKINKLLTYFVVQTRKRNVDLYVCTHHIDHVDKRLRRAVDIRGTCRFVSEDPCKRCGGTGEFKNDETYDAWEKIMPPNTCGRCFGEGKTGFSYTTFFNRRASTRWQRVRRIAVPAPMYWNLYDTEERIALTSKQKAVTLEDVM